MVSIGRLRPKINRKPTSGAMKVAVPSVHTTEAESMSPSVVVVGGNKLSGER